MLLCGLALAGFMFWQLFTDASMLDVDVQTKGPVIVVIYSLVALIVLGAAVSFSLIKIWAQRSFWVVY